MSIKVRVSSSPSYIVRTVGIGSVSSTPGASQLVDLNDVDASSLDNNETIVYDANTETFVVKSLPIVDGGTF